MIYTYGGNNRPPSWSCNRLSACGSVIWFETAQDQETGEYFVRQVYPESGGWNRIDLWAGPFETRDEAARAAVS
jgi:hypothetical protein